MEQIDMSIEKMKYLIEKALTIDFKKYKRRK